MILKNSINNVVKKVTASLNGESGPEEAPSFISIWQTDNAGTSNTDQIALPLNAAGTYNFSVKYNGSVIKTITSYTDNIITFPDGAGTKEIEIEGEIIGWRFNNGGDCLKLLDVSNWGPFALGPVEDHFQGCENFNITASDAPDLSFTTSLRESFERCSSLNTDNIGTWDTSAIINFSRMFLNCITFNGNVGFNTSSANSMAVMFANCQQFNQPVSTFDTSNVTSMEEMFRDCFVFNQSVSTFDTSNVTNMEEMFRKATNFNQPLPFNTSSVTSFNLMFFQATNFNQPLPWDTSAVTNMKDMFWQATNFNQDLSSWDFSNVTTCNRMFLGSSFDITNYDLLLISLASQSLQSNVPFNAGTAQYSVGTPTTARNILTGTYLWTITDGGQAP